MALPLTETPAARIGRALDISCVGLGVGLPDEVVRNDAWIDVLQTTDEWIVTRTGIRERLRAAPEEATSDLAVRASLGALADAGMESGDLGAVVVTTNTPDYTIPQVGPIVAGRLGIDVAAFDVGAGCSAFLYGLAVAAGLLAGGVADPVLLIGAETMSRVVDAADRETAFLFGDGAGACVLTARAEAAPGEPSGSLGPFDLGSDGELADLIITPAGGSRVPPTAETVAAGQHTLRMRGREVYRHAVTRMTASSQAVLDQAGLTARDVDVFVGHQANARILEAVGKRLGIGDEQAFMCVERYGNTSAASIPIALAAAQAAGRLVPGARILLTAFGAGLTWGSCMMTWPGRSQVRP